MKFTYRAIDEQGTIVRNTIESDNKADVVRYLQGAQLVPVEIRAENNVFEKVGKGGVKFTDVVNFTRQLSLMLTAGLNIVDAFAILKKQETRPAMLEMYTKMETQIKSGLPLSKALQEHPHLFSSMYIALVRSGEASGKLNEIMMELADTLEEQRNFNSKLRSALIYPAFIIIAIIVVVGVIMTVVVPQLLKLFEDFDVTLPITTQIVIALSNFMKYAWWLMLLVGFFGWRAFQNAMKTHTFKRAVDARLLQLPVLGNLIRMGTLVNATKTLAVLTKAGVSILTSLSIIKDTTDNVVFQDSFDNVLKKVERGVGLGEAMDGEGLFPPLLVQMTTVGEQTGSLDQTLLKVGKFFEYESSMAIKAFSSLIEPLILVVLGGVVGFIVMAVITPIYSLTTSIK